MLKTKTAKTQYGDLFYLDGEKGEQIIFFLHGYLGTPHLGHLLDNRFAQKGFRIISPFLPGHGRTFPIRKDIAFKEIVNVMNQFLVSVASKKQKIYLLGHSFGGTLALALGSINPAFNNIFVCDPYLENTEQPELLTLFRVLKELWRGGAAQASVKNYRNISIPRLSTFLRWRQIRDIPVDLLLVPGSTKIKIVWGKDDQLAPLEKFEHVIKKLPDPKLKIIAGYHYWCVMHPEAFLAEVNTFLTER